MSLWAHKDITAEGIVMIAVANINSVKQIDLLEQGLAQGTQHD